MNSNATYFVGVDLHKAVLQICVLNSNGEVVKSAAALVRESNPVSCSPTPRSSGTDRVGRGPAEATFSSTRR